MITHAEIKANIRKKYEDRMKDMSKDEKIEYLEDCKFNIDMIDRWSQEDEFYYDVVCKLLREVKDKENLDDYVIEKRYLERYEEVTKDDNKSRI